MVDGIEIVIYFSYMKKYTYKTKDGKIISSDVPLKEEGLTLVRKIKSVNMESNQVRQK